MGKCAEFVHGTTELGNGRAGSECPFSPGDRNRFAGRQAHPLLHSRGHRPGSAASGNPRVGQGDPGVKPGALLPGLPPFIWSRREDHGPNGNGPNGNGPNGNGPNGNGPNGNGPNGNGPNGNGPNGYDLNGYVWVIVWVVGPESPGLTGTHRDSPGLTGTHRDSPGLTGTHRDSPGLTGTHRDSPGLTGTHRDLPGLTGTHRDSPGLTGTHRDSPGLTGTHRDSSGLTGTYRDLPGLTGTHRDLPGLTGGRFALGSKANWQGGDGAPPRGRRPTVVDGRTWVSGTDVKEQMDWEVRGVHLRT